jgi:hypothetical protein
MAKKGFKRELCAIIIRYTHKLSHYASSTKNPIFKTVFFRLYQSLNQVIEHRGGQSCIDMKMPQCQFEG